MKRYVFEVGINCGLLIAVDAPDAELARYAALWAMKDHVAESCNGIDASLTDNKPECLVVTNGDGDYAWGDLVADTAYDTTESGRYM
jgi:hypothetical protein